MKDKVSIKRFLAILLCAAMVITFMPVPKAVYAGDGNEAEVIETEAPAQAEAPQAEAPAEEASKAEAAKEAEKPEAEAPAAEAAAAEAPVAAEEKKEEKLSADKVPAEALEAAELSDAVKEELKPIEGELKPIDGEITPIDGEITPVVFVRVPNVEGATVTYDGSNHQITATKPYNAPRTYTLEYSEDGETWGTNNPTYTNVGEYTVYVRGRQASSSSGSTAHKYDYSKTVSATLVIEQLTVSLVIRGNSRVTTYNGEEQKAEGFTYTARVGNKDFAGTDVTVTAADGYVAEAKGTKASSDPYKMGLSKDTLDISASDNVIIGSTNITDGQLIINKARVMITITGNHDTVEYNGEEQSVEGFTYTAMGPGGKDFAQTGDVEVALQAGKEAKASGTNANERPYMMGLTADSFLFAITDNVEPVGRADIRDGWLLIEKAYIKIEIKGHTGSFMFDGSSHTVEGYDCDVTVPGASSDSVKVTLKPGRRAEVSRRRVGQDFMRLSERDFNVVVSGLDSNNYHTHTYDFQITDGWIKILWVELDVQGYEGEYDGEAHGITASIATIVDPAVETAKTVLWYSTDGRNWSRENPTFTNVGTYTVYVQARNSSYERYPVTEEAQVVITPKKVTVTVTGNSDTVIYDGKEHTVTLYDYKITDKDGNEVEGLSIVSTSRYKDATGTTAGTYPMNLKEADFALRPVEGLTNYDPTWEIIDGWLEITPRNVKLVVNGNTKTVLYNGTEQSVSGFTYEITVDNSDGNAFGADELTIEYRGDNGSVKHSEASGTEVGKYDMTMGYEMFDIVLAADSELDLGSIILERPTDFTLNNGWLEITEPTPEPTPASGGGGTTTGGGAGGAGAGGGAAAAAAAGAADGAAADAAVADATDIADNQTPTTEAPATTTIEDESTPTTLTWAVGNLAMAIITALGAIVGLFRRKEDEDESGDKKLASTKIAGVLAGIAAPVTFFLTEDMSNLAVAFDKWTPLMAGILAVGAVSFFMGKAAAKASDVADKAKDALN